ncbi:AGE family epimerase/isomerase [Lachnospiraceae bacterium 29-84]
MDKRGRLQAVKGQMEEFLIRSVTFWLEHGLDPTYGGYLVCFDENGKPMERLDVMEPTDKMIVTQTRMIWGFSALLRNGMAKRYGWEEACKSAASQGVDFFLKHFWDPKNGGFAWYTNRAGEVQDNGKLVYGQTFAIYALSEYAMATGDKTAREYAEQTFDLLMKYCVDTARGGFYENLTEDWTPETEIDKGGDLKSLDIHMHAMEAFTTLYECTRKENHKRKLKEVIDVITSHMIDYAYACGRNQFTYGFVPKAAREIRRTWNYDRAPQEANQNPMDTTSYGHNIELAWLLNRAYEVMGETPAKELTKKIADYTLTNGWDYEHGGIFRDGNHDGRVVTTDKEWWQNFESLTGLLDAYQAVGEERYLEKFLELWEFDRTYFYNETAGESRQLLKADGTALIADTGNQWKCIYHTDRAMMECIPRIEILVG